MKDHAALVRVGMAGFGLLRLAPDGPRAEIEAALEAMRSSLDALSPEMSQRPCEVDSLTGYREWAQNYDEPGNPLISLEEPVMNRLLERLRPGLAIDLAAGTGRHARRLAKLGHQVLAVDLNQAMLAALSSFTDVRLAVADMSALPVANASVDLVVCSLALTHVPVLQPAISEIARVLRPGGRAVLSDIHPVLAATGGMAYYTPAGSEQRFVRNHVHWPSEYVSAISASGLLVRECLEPKLGAESGVPHFLGSLPPPLEGVASRAFAGLPGALLWEVERRA